MEKDLISLVYERAKEWLNESYDEQTRKRVEYLIKNDEKTLIDAFYRDLEFGTGGMRAIMDAGTNRMNIYTIGKATQGLSSYLLKTFKNKKIKIAIAHDSRNNSRLFAETAAKIFAANGIKVYLFESLRPTPELSFAIRYLQCQSGVVVTASHNPKEYNGYKVYWEDGGQIVPPHDNEIIQEVNNTSIKDIKWKGNEDLINIIGEEIDTVYLNKIKELSLSPLSINKYKDLKIVYTPIHGTGVKLVPQSLKNFGFTNIINIPSQDISDGNFPTVISPNPEETEALTLAKEKAMETGAELVLATDPDADRVGIAVRNNNNEIILLNGNQTGSLLIYYLLNRWHANNKIRGKEYIVKTIVTTDLITSIASKFNVKCYEVLTGFKYIAEKIKLLEGKQIFIGGGEESYGYLAGDFVRDKDAVIACSLIAEACAWAKSEGKTLYNLLLDIYIEFGYYKEKLINVTKKGKEGLEEIITIMNNFRDNPPKKLGNSEVIRIIDYEKQSDFDLSTGKINNVELPKSNVIQFFTKNESKITIRPSGTEPKIKFYFSVKGKLNTKNEFESIDNKMAQYIDKIAKEIGV
jgi:phosphoglucomutase